MATGNESIVPEQELHDFVVRCMEAVGTNTEHADVLADLIVAADTRGHYSHGLNRLGKIRLLFICRFSFIFISQTLSAVCLIKDIITLSNSYINQFEKKIS